MKKAGFEEKVKEEEKLETHVLKKFIIKMGQMLTIGFGQAGTSIIYQNTKRGKSIDNLDLFIPGVKIMGIYGYYSINNFEKLAESFGGDLFLLLNEVAEIIHSNTEFFIGSAD